MVTVKTKRCKLRLKLAICKCKGGGRGRGVATPYNTTQFFCSINNSYYAMAMGKRSPRLNFEDKL